MRDHIKLLGVISLVWSSVSLLAGLVILAVFGGAAGLIRDADASQPNPGVVPFFAFLWAIFVLVICIIALPGLVGAIGLLRMRPWSRPLMLVVSVLHLLSFPIGTALGVYGLWVLLQPGTRLAIERGEASAGLPARPPV